MKKTPKDPKEICGAFTNDYKKIFKQDLVAILLYGSAAGGSYRPGISDINMMVVLSESGIDRLDVALDVIPKWLKRNVAVPLFVTESYIHSSLDVFPVEYLGFQRHYALVHGKDVLSNLTFDREHVRLQCERETKGKLLLLREAFLETLGKSRKLKGVITSSLPAFVSIFNALLFLEGKEGLDKDREVFHEACITFGLDQDLFQKLLDLKEEKIRLSHEQIHHLFHNYLKEVRKLAEIVDELGG